MPKEAQFSEVKEKYIVPIGAVPKLQGTVCCLGGR